MLRRLYIKLVLVVGLIFAMYGIAKGIFDKRGEQLKEESIQVIRSITYNDENRTYEKNMILDLLKDERYMPQEIAIDLNRVLSKLYLRDKNVNSSISYSQKAAYLAKVTKDNYTAALCCLDVVNSFFSLNYYDAAKEMLGRAVIYMNRVEDKDQKQRLREIIQYDYAQISVALGDGEEAQNYLNMEFPVLEKEIDNFTIRKNILVAFSYYYSGEYEKAKEILDYAQTVFSIGNYYPISNISRKTIELPFYRLRVLLLLQQKDIDKALAVNKEFLNSCKEQDNIEAKILHLQEVVDILSKEDVVLSSEAETILRNYKDILIEDYPRSLKNNMDKSGTAMFSDYMVSLAKLTSNHTMYLILKNAIQIILIVSVIILVLVYFLTTALSNNRLDGLTGARNRAYFNKVIHRKIKKQQNFSIVLLDIDYFKNINDNFGHLYGDEVLRKVTRKIEKLLNGKEQLFRYGGEEFCVLTNKTNKNELWELAEGIRKGIEELSWAKNQTITASIGVASSGECNKNNTGCINENDLIQLADRRMYDAKEQGRNKVSM